MVKYEWDESNGVSVPTNKLMVIDADEYYVGMPLKKVDAETVAPTDGEIEYICLAQRNAGDEIRPLQIPVQEVFPDAVYTKITEDGTEEKVKFGGGGKIKPEQLPDGYPYEKVEWTGGVNCPSMDEADPHPFLLEGFPVFAAGDTVNVKIDDKEYSLVAFEELGAYFIGDKNDPFMQGVGKYGWMIGCMDGVVLMMAYEPHIVKWGTSNIVKIGRKFLPEGYPYKEEKYLAKWNWDETEVDGHWAKIGNTIISNPYDILGFNLVKGDSVSHIVINENMVAVKDDYICVYQDYYQDNPMIYFVFNEFKGSSGYLFSPGIYLFVGGTKPVGSGYIGKVSITVMSPEFLPGGAGGGAMIVTTDSITFGNANTTDFWTSANLESLYYDDGSRASYSNSDKLINALNSGTPVYLFCDGRRRGEIWAAYATETSGGFVLVLKGVVYPEYYSGKCGVIGSWVN